MLVISVVCRVSFDFVCCVFTVWATHVEINWKEEVALNRWLAYWWLRVHSSRSCGHFKVPYPPISYELFLEEQGILPELDDRLLQVSIISKCCTRWSSWPSVFALLWLIILSLCFTNMIYFLKSCSYSSQSRMKASEAHKCTFKQHYRNVIGFIVRSLFRFLFRIVAQSVFLFLYPRGLWELFSHWRKWALSY